MRILLILTFICGLVVQPPIRLSQEESAQVANVLATERQQFEAKFSRTFVITDETLIALKDRGVPENVRTALASIKDTTFDEDKFRKQLEDKLEPGDFKTYQPMILAQARRTLKIDPEFANEVTRLVLQTQSAEPKGKKINEELDEQHQRFLKNIISFAEKEKGAHNDIRLSMELLQAYKDDINLTIKLLEAYRPQAQFCNQNPCPGCPCKNCSRKC